MNAAPTPEFGSAPASGPLATQACAWLPASDLATLDPEVARLLALERERQLDHVILIASESFCPAPVRAALASEFTNIYAEGYASSRMTGDERGTLGDLPRHLAFYRRYADRRYYKGTECCDFIEVLAQKRAAKMFADEARGVRPEDIWVNVQPLSGAAANNAVYNAFTEPGDVVMGIELSHGGHLTHGSPFNRSGREHEIVSYGVDPKTGRLDYDRIVDLARRHKPKLLIGGASAYPWAFDWEALRRAADAAGDCILLADVAHPAGLIVAGEYPNPIAFAHVVSTTTHKTLCGPRGAILMCTDSRLRDRLDTGVFPGEQGGPHMNCIAAKAVAFGLALTPEFKALGRRVRDNARAFAEALVRRGLQLVYGGTDSHLLLIDCKSLPGSSGAGTLNGDIASRILDLAGITLNKNTVAGDVSAANPSGLRIGTTWISQLGMGRAEVDRLAGVIADLLGAIEVFDVPGAFGRLGRGKLPWEVFHQARAQVALLTRQFPVPALDAGREADERLLLGPPVAYPLASAHAAAGATLAETGANPGSDELRTPRDFGDPEAEWQAARERAALIDVSAGGLFELIGERAHAALQQLTTADLAGLEAGEARHTFMLDGEGALLSRATVLCLPDRKGARADEIYRRYWLRVPAEKRVAVREWLAGHSDGYFTVEHDADPYLKIDGPLSVLDRRTHERTAPPLATLLLVGPRAQAIAGQAVPGVADQPRGTSHTYRVAERVVVVAHGADAFGRDAYELTVVRAEVGWLWQHLRELGGDALTPAGTDVLDRFVHEAGLDLTDLEALVARFPERFAIGTAYFVGQRAVEALGTLPAEPRPRAFSWIDREETDAARLKHSCLEAQHKKLGATLVPFAGWQMPVLYTSIGEEHRAVRTACGLFDVSHMGVFELEGAHAARFLDLTTTNYITRLKPGQSYYGFLLAPDGSVIDDALVYRRGPDRFLVVVNASNADKDFAWLTGVNEGTLIVDAERPWRGVEGRVTIRNLKEDESLGPARRADLALQGPSSLALLQALAEDTGTRARLEVLEKSEFFETTLAGCDLLLARTGYTGEQWGFELYVHPERAPELWEAILERHGEFGVVAAGLGARDSTRTEAGFPLYGHELAGPHDITPMEAGYGAFVKRHKPFFVGRQATLVREAAREMEVIRFRMLEAGVRTIHPGAPVVSRKGVCVGFVTSAALVGRRQMGLAWVKKTQARPGARLGLFVPPRRSPKPTDWAGFALGDQALLHEPLEVLPRFPESPAELLDNLEP